MRFSGAVVEFVVPFEDVVVGVTRVFAAECEDVVDDEDAEWAAFPFKGCNNSEGLFGDVIAFIERFAFDGDDCNVFNFVGDVKFRVSLEISLLGDGVIRDNTACGANGADTDGGTDADPEDIVALIVACLCSTGTETV